MAYNKREADPVATEYPVVTATDPALDEAARRDDKARVDAARLAKYQQQPRVRLQAAIDRSRHRGDVNDRIAHLASLVHEMAGHVMGLLPDAEPLETDPVVQEDVRNENEG